jgi:protein involved in polysaccharide export with SLBB domain
MKKIAFLTVFISFFAPMVLAQSVPNQANDQKHYSAQNIASSYGSNMSSAGRAMPVAAGSIYGSSLFNAASTPLRSTDPNPNYVLSPGDMVDIKTYGAISHQQASQIDADGNIFLPDIGPVRLAGTKRSELNNKVSKEFGNIYKDTVQVYTELAGSQHVSVFVTGEVAKPGRYLGDSRFSIIDYISHAGGIDSVRGSFRNVSIIRNNKQLVDVDVYEFLKEGKMPNFTLQEGDTILVLPRGAVVEVDGATNNKFFFEFSSNKPITGDQLIRYAAPFPNTTNAIISGTRNGMPYRDHKSLSDLNQVTLENGDKVTFTTGGFAEKIAINISGAHKSASSMVIPADAKLSEVLDNISIHPSLSNVSAIYIKRKSVAESQKRSIQDSLKKLQETILLAKTSGVTQGSSITEGDAKVLDVLIQRAAEVQPEGRLVLSNNVNKGNITLEEGDEIVIPQITQVVTVSGEVLVPQAIIWDSAFSVKDYISKTGGFNDRANESQIVVIRANGETEIGYGVKVKPGDQIMILPEVKLNNLEVAGKVMEIIYKAAVAIAIPFRL